VLEACAEYVVTRLASMHLFPEPKSKSESKAKSKAEPKPVSVSLFDASVIAAKAKRYDILHIITAIIAQYYRQYASLKLKERSEWTAEEEKVFDGFDEKSAKYWPMLDSKTTHQLMKKNSSCQPIQFNTGFIKIFLRGAISSYEVPQEEKEKMLELIKGLTTQVRMQLSRSRFIYLFIDSIYLLDFCSSLSSACSCIVRVVVVCLL
jgi:hypothetical protein